MSDELDQTSDQQEVELNEVEVPEVESAADSEVAEVSEDTKSDPTSQHVPFTRFQKTLNEKKALEAEIAELKAQAKTEPEKVEEDSEDDDAVLDERSARAVRKEAERLLKERKYLSHEDLERMKAEEKAADALREQVEADKAEISSWAEGKGYPTFDAAKVVEWAEENIGPNSINSKAALKAAYLAMNEEAILSTPSATVTPEVERPAAVPERPGAPARAEAPAEKTGGLRGSILNALRD